MIPEHEMSYDTDAMTADLTDEPELEAEVEVEAQEVEEEAPQPQVYVIDGVEYDETAIRAAARFRQWLAADPRRQDDLVAWERGERVMVPTAFEPEDAYQTWQPDPTVESDDDEYLTDEEKRVRQLEARLNAYERQQAEIAAQEDRDVIDAGLVSFRESHPELDQEGFNAVLLTIRNKGWMAGLNDKPLSPTQKVRAIQDLAEDAYKVVYFETARQQAQQEAMSQVTRQVRARRRASAAGGTSPSVPRSEPDPSQMSEAERFDAMTRDLAAHMAQQ